MRTFQAYEEWLQPFKLYIKLPYPLQYCTMKLAGEVGEVSEKIAKTYRDHNGTFSPERKLEIAKELGDVLWYLTAISGELGFSLARVAELNMEKLNSRLERGTLQGEGDNR